MANLPDKATAQLMLRDFIIYPDMNIMRAVLSQFMIQLPDDPYYISIVRFEVITPDLFIWRLSIGQKIYYLYAEDYTDFNRVKQVLHRYVNSRNLHFMPVKKPAAFQEASPVTSAQVYMEPEDSGEMIRYAAQSGYDFVFLAASTEDGSNAYFSESAPRGFDPDSASN